MTGIVAGAQPIAVGIAIKDDDANAIA